MQDFHLIKITPSLNENKWCSLVQKWFDLKRITLSPTTSRRTFQKTGNTEILAHTKNEVCDSTNEVCAVVERRHRSITKTIHRKSSLAPTSWTRNILQPHQQGPLLRPHCWELRDGRCPALLLLQSHQQGG
ncbi:hypothetical protein KC19_VG134800 [Ceratodon purpureus]|uniref:Uncharacterized protein n=1 Tax=Ceratodon purpureus TaxID=3225 RepID=A0A8T0HQ60_CERPU|nr:hypothetical protein KC19_VG134800 [Ceratodon purpureus]